jgi:hypothetical protein
MRQPPKEGVVNRSTVVVVLAIFLLGVLAGVALAKWLVSAVAAIGVAVVVVVHRRWREAEPEGCG